MGMMCERDRLAVCLMAIGEWGVGEEPKSYIQFCESFLSKHRNAEHSGDCKKEPWSCLRCICDDYLEKADHLLSAFPVLTTPKPQSNLLPSDHQDPSKWVSREDMEQAHAAGRDDPVILRDPKEPVAWRVKGYADDWILFRSHEQAKKEARAGNLVQPLYTTPPK